ncbi:MAG TPA: hypothetical protein VMH28_14465 [Candidatus Acidoferrales bacterium]|nr:hypothetical protein [Candidatus Acidoferrales bacterium]
MAIGILGPLNDVINKTSSEIVDGQILSKLAKVINTFVSSSFDAADSTLVRLRDVTKPDPPASGATQ